MADIAVTVANVLVGASPQVANGFAGEAILQGQSVYKAANGTWMKAQCDGTAIQAGFLGDARYRGVLISAEGYNDAAPAPFVLRRFTARSYSRIGTLAAICEWPRYTQARLAVKRRVLSAARGVAGEWGYEKVRDAVVSRKMRNTTGGSRKA